MLNYIYIYIYIYIYVTQTLYIYILIIQEARAQLDVARLVDAFGRAARP